MKLSLYTEVYKWVPIKNILQKVTRRSTLNHSYNNMAVFGISLHHCNTESRKSLEQKFIFQIGTGINERFSLDLFILIFSVTMIPPKAWLHRSLEYKPHTTHNSLIHSDEGLTLETSVLEPLYGGPSSSLTNFLSFTACIQRLSQSKVTAQSSHDVNSSDVTPTSSCSTGAKSKSSYTEVTSSASSEKTYILKGTRLIVLYSFESKAFDDLTVRPGEYVYANLKDQIVPDWIWAYSPHRKKSGFIPEDHVKEPVVTDI